MDEQIRYRNFPVTAFLPLSIINRYYWFANTAKLNLIVDQRYDSRIYFPKRKIVKFS